MKIKYIGESDNYLTNGQVYEVSHYAGQYLKNSESLTVVDNNGSLSLVFNGEFTFATYLGKERSEIIE